MICDLNAQRLALAVLTQQSPPFLGLVRLIALAVVPTYGEDGKIVYAGADLDKGGVTEHCFDIIYTVSFVHVSVVLWRYFWLLLLVIPGYAFFKLMKDVVIPWSAAPIHEHCRVSRALDGGICSELSLAKRRRPSVIEMPCSCTGLVHAQVPRAGCRRP